MLTLAVITAADITALITGFMTDATTESMLEVGAALGGVSILLRGLKRLVR